MTALEKIESFLFQNAGRAYCDDCLSKFSGIHPGQQVQLKTSRLAKDSRFRRQIGFCAKHGRDEKYVICLRVPASTGEIRTPIR
jgi:hypothetical protein